MASARPHTPYADAPPTHLVAADDLAAIADPAAVRDLLDGAAVRAVFQPILDLRTRSVRGFEAFVRGPQGHRLETPAALFAAARAANALPALDAGCVATALLTAQADGLGAAQTLFVNIEADSHCVDVLPALARHIDTPVVVELTERALTVDPARVLATVEVIRRLGWGVALDDVGVNPDSLALLPLIAPDVIKLDLGLVQDRPTAHTAHVFSAVAHEVERSGCLVVAEGIETTAHLHAAHALGAHLGQGWLFGPPDRLPLAIEEPTAERIRLRGRQLPVGGSTPFAVASKEREVHATTKPLLLTMSKHLERQATAIGESCLVLTTFQTAKAFAPAARRYAALAARNAYVAAFGRGIVTNPAPGVRGIDLYADEPLSREWSLVVLGPHYAAVLAAELIDDGTGGDMNWDYVLSHDRELVVRAAASLMNRIPGRTDRRPSHGRCS